MEVGTINDGLSTGVYLKGEYVVSIASESRVAVLHLVDAQESPVLDVVYVDGSVVTVSRPGDYDAMNVGGAISVAMNSLSLETTLKMADVSKLSSGDLLADNVFLAKGCEAALREKPFGAADLLKPQVIASSDVALRFIVAMHDADMLCHLDDNVLDVFDGQYDQAGLACMQSSINQMFGLDWSGSVFDDPYDAAVSVSMWEEGMDALSNELSTWQATHNMPTHQCALEMLLEMPYTDTRRRFLVDYIQRWESANEQSIAIARERLVNARAL